LPQLLSEIPAIAIGGPRFASTTSVTSHLALLTEEIAMLVLTRRVGQTIVIDGHIQVTVTAIKGSSQIRIGITAPTDISIRRQELEPRTEEFASSKLAMAGKR